MTITVDQAQALARPDLAKKASKDPNSAADLGDRFLTLLVTQMRNQDPLNPMQNAEVTTQLAQISTVTGVDKLNTSIETMSKSMSTGQTYQAAGLVGRGVLASGDMMDLKSGKAMGVIDLKDAARTVTIDIFDKNNKRVRTLELEAQPAGVSQFAWDGKDDKGIVQADDPYTFSITAKNNGKSVESASMSIARVDSVTLGGAEVMVNTGLLGSFPMSGIKQIF